MRVIGGGDRRRRPDVHARRLGVDHGRRHVRDQGPDRARGCSASNGLPAGWVLKAVSVNGTDITDTGIDIKPTEPVTGMEIVLTQKTTEVNGSVKAGSRPAADYTVVIFSEDEAEVDGADDPPRHRRAPEPGGPVPGEEPAGGQLLRHRARLHRAGRLERSGSPAAAEERRPRASRSPRAK